MEHLDCISFQEAVSRCLVRHKSILDCTSKLDEASARVNRAIAKAVTTCGCLKISASRQTFPSCASYSELRNYTTSHLEGALCPDCRDVLETEIGRTLFYVAALCDLLDLDMEEVIQQEQGRLSTLGIFNLT
ncbi:MAG: DUF1573 domain-containing protein [Firmicutes bacterium]|jgi:hypothetical protein|nr:DUF1573 domain-containing protein [Bacillota bacterium]